MQNKDLMLYKNTQIKIGNKIIKSNIMLAPMAGITDVVTKVHGSTNKINVVKATLNGLLSIKTKQQIADKRNKSVEEI